MASAIFFIVVGMIVSLHSTSSQETTISISAEEFQKVEEEVNFVPVENRTNYLIHKYVTERRRAEKFKADLGAINEQKNVVIDVLLPFVAFVKSRGRIEHLERLFALKYVSPKKVSQKMLKSSIQVYEYHLMMWEWIWNNCQDSRFLTIKNAAIKEFNNDPALAKQLVTSSYAGVFLGTSESAHVPKRLLGLNITIDDLVNALDDFQDLDADSIKCFKLAWL